MDDHIAIALLNPPVTRLESAQRPPEAGPETRIDCLAHCRMLGDAVTQRGPPEWQREQNAEAAINR